MSFSDKINVTLPPDQGEKTTLGASRIRSLKRAICERLSGLVYGFKSDDTESDETKQGFWKVSLNKLTSSPTHEQDKGIVYVKEVDGKVELFYKDSSGNEKQITSAGKLNVGNEAVLLTGDQDVDGVKTFLKEPTVPTPTADGKAANKGYVDGFNYVPSTPTANKPIKMDANAKLPTTALKTYDTGWFAVSANTDYTITHNLGTDKLLITAYARHPDLGNVGFVLYYSFDDIGDTRGNPQIRINGLNSIIVRAGVNYAIMANMGGGDIRRTTADYRIIILALE